MMDRMTLFMGGAIAMACLVAALVFLRSWRETRDRLFLLFGLSFLGETLSRIGLVATLNSPNEAGVVFYTIRLASYALILVAIVDKSRAGYHE